MPDGMWALIGVLLTIAATATIEGFRRGRAKAEATERRAEARRAERLSAYSDVLGTLTPFFSSYSRLSGIRGLGVQDEILLSVLNEFTEDYEAMATALYRARLVAPTDAREEYDPLIKECLETARERVGWTDADQAEVEAMNKKLVNFFQSDIDRSLAALESEVSVDTTK